jgi:hypothetical protein
MAAGVATAATKECAADVKCHGTAKSDVVIGTNGSNLIRGLGGADTIYTHASDGPSGDADRIVSGSGSDTIYANDGDANDIISCGDGASDVANVDQGDAVKATCETVNRPGSPTTPPPPSDVCPNGSQDVTKHASSPLTPNDFNPDDVNLQSQITAAPAGTTLCFPAGVYDMQNQVDVRVSGLTLQGLEGATIKRSPSSASNMMFRFIYSQNTRVTGFKLDGGAAGDTWDEYGIVFTVYSSQNADFDHNTFRNVMGDGVYYGRASYDTNYTCNTGADVADNTFIGSNNASRNGISLICGSGFNVLRNTITNWSRNDMPGCIDLEPNSASERLDNVLVEGNTCDNTNGTRLKWGGITAALAQHGSHSSNVTIRGNEVKGAIGQGVAVETNPQDAPWIVQNNNVHDLTGGPVGGVAQGLHNYGSNTYMGNTVSNVNGGSGRCFYNYGGSPVRSDNTFTGCV